YHTCLNWVDLSHVVQRDLEYRARLRLPVFDLTMRPTLFRLTGYVHHPPEHKKKLDTARTISHRLAQLRKVPAELIPLAVVLGLGIGAAIFALGHKLLYDDLRLTPSKKKKEH
ncbi:hypothetical protein NEOLI_001040, partial [Neolecta irregularis DAH-3]